jgi:hypothetical protein
LEQVVLRAKLEQTNTMDETLELLTRLAKHADHHTFIGVVTIVRDQDGIWRVGFGSPEKRIADTRREVGMKAGGTFRDAALRALADPRPATCIMGMEEAALLGLMGD